MYDLLARKLMGVKYEKALKSIFAAVVIFFGLHELEYSVKVSQKVILFSDLFFSGTIVMQTLNSEDNARYLRGVFAMPFMKKTFMSGYALAVGMYTLFTKTILLFLFILAFSESIELLNILLMLADFIFVCLGAMVVYAFYRDKVYISVFTLAAGIAMCFIVPENALALVIYAAADILLAFVVAFTDPYRFMKRSSEKVKKVKGSSGGRFIVLKYILRYMAANKAYLVSTAAIMAFCVYIAWSTSGMGLKNSSIMAMALLSVNTPLAVIVSSSRTLKKKLCSMPDQFRAFYLPYGTVLFAFYILSYSVFLLILYFIKMEIKWVQFLAAVLFALQASAITVFLEEKHTLTNWRTEPDLWHNPRKYIIPVILAAESMIFQLL